MRVQKGKGTVGDMFECEKGLYGSEICQGEMCGV
jgi:hypothetical protein